MSAYRDRRPLSARLGLLPAVLCFALVAGCDGSPTDRAEKAADRWVGTWGTAPQLVEPRNMPPEPGLAGNTLRQVVHVSLGGELLRAHFSNAFSTQPVTMKAVRVAESAGGGAVMPETGRVLTFEGRGGVTMQPGAAVVSDPFAFDLKPGANLAITIHFGDTSPDVTGHPGSRTTSYLEAGDAVQARDLSDAVRTDHWYVVAGLDVKAPAPAAAVVVLGDSITDGRGSGTNKQNRWPDELARRLRAEPGTGRVAVLNAGIGGNCVLRDCLGPAALDRFGRDVLGQAGVDWLIVLEGINDIGQAKPDEAAAVARDLVDAYTRMIERAHAADIRVYGATLMPFGESFYDSAEHKAARQTVNAWIRNSGRFDAVIDLDAALRDPAHPSRLLPAADTGDHLHPSETGHRMMAEAVDLALFKSEGGD